VFETRAGGCASGWLIKHALYQGRVRYILRESSVGEYTYNTRSWRILDLFTSTTQSNLTSHTLQLPCLKNDNNFHRQPEYTGQGRAPQTSKSATFDILTVQGLQIISLSKTTVEADLGLLRPGKQFTIIQPEAEDDIRKCLEKGHFNLHFPIVFEDGVKWLLRVRRDYNRPEHPVCPPEHYWFGVEREVATLQAMAAAGLKTVPNAYLSFSKDSVTPGA